MSDDLLYSQSALVSSHLLEPREMRGAYLRQAGWVGVTILFNLAVLPFLDGDDQKFQRQTVNLVIGVGIVVEILILVSYWLVKQAPGVHAAELRRTLKPLPPRQQAKLQRALAPIRESIGLKRRIDILVNTRAQHWGPSVAEDRFGAILVVPTGFFKLLQEDPPAATAILAHELGHVQERDSWIFTTQTASARLFQYVVVPAISVLFVIGLAAPSLYKISVAGLIAAYRNGRAARNRLRMARLTSEERADLYGCIHGDPEGLLRVFQDHAGGTSKRDSYKHPKLELRISAATTTRMFLAKEKAALAAAPDVPPPPEVPSVDLNAVLAHANQVADAPRKYKRWRPGR